MEGDNHPRGGSLSRPCAHADFGPSQILGFRDNGIPEGQVVANDIPEVVQRQVQVTEPRILVPWILR